MIVDLHMHLRNPAEEIDHRVEAVERFVETARSRGVDEIGFTEHVYCFRQTRELWEASIRREPCAHDLGAYVEAVLEARRRGLPVKLGLEVDYVGVQQARLAELLRPYPWDFLLGSVHWLDGRAVDQEPGLWGLCSVEDVWRRYFAALGELYPDTGLLRACRRRGVTVTLASDAHVPDLVGIDFPAAIEHARAAGYDTVTVFEGRVPRQVPLG